MPFLRKMRTSRKKRNNRSTRRKGAKRRHLGGNPLPPGPGAAPASVPMPEMPQLCFGTAQANLEVALSKAFDLGYRHIDGAEVYGSRGFGYEPGQYKSIVKKCIQEKIPNRHDLWITWKADEPTFDKIEKIVGELDCGYIDLFLVHHGCGSDADFGSLDRAQKAGLIRYFGVSNCENIGKILELKEKYGDPFYANQIQARPPGGSIQGRGKLDADFIERCNGVGVRIMLFATMSGFIGTNKNNELQLKYLELLEKYPELSNNKKDIKNIKDLKNINDISIIKDIKSIKDINKYYIQKYLRPSNVLMVSSLSGSSLKQNLDDVTAFLSGRELLNEEQMNRIETILMETELNFM